MSTETEYKNEEYRDRMSNISEEGKRIWIYPKKPSGKFYKARSIVSYFLIAFLFIGPFIRVGGHQFILLDVLQRNFVLFGIPFGPHDFHLFVIAMIAIIISIFLFTVVYGRIFCGWICPQTVFMEMVFRKIEYLIEGNYKKQQALDKAPWTSEKIFKKSLKHIIFYGLSFLISNIFLAYIIGSDKLIKIISAPPSEHFAGLTAILIFSGVFYFVFARFREQACTMVCPYGRLQGVMLDPNSIVIAYDYLRGEPRGVSKKNEPEDTYGDCVNCNQCVEVCPTGIDIRNGTQLECVNCTNCIDACDEVMTKVKKPKGLIRYASLNDIQKKGHKYFSPRAIGYTVVLFVLYGLLAFLLLNRSDFELAILRTPGMLFQQQPNNKISNLYDFTLTNKTFDTIPAELKLKGIKGEIKVIGSDLKVKPEQTIVAKVMVVLPENEIKQLNTPLQIEVTAKGKPIDVIKTSFLGKVKKGMRKRHRHKR